MLTHKATEATVSTSQIYVALTTYFLQWKWRITHPVAPCTLEITALLQPHRVIWYSRHKTLIFLSKLISSLTIQPFTAGMHKFQAPGHQWQQNFVQFHLISVGPQHQICFVSLFWHLVIWNVSEINGKYVHPSFRVAIFQFKNRSIILMTEISATLQKCTHTHTHPCACMHTLSLSLTHYTNVHAHTHFPPNLTICESRVCYPGKCIH